MVVSRPEDDERWSYRRNAVERVVDAVADMIRLRLQR
jgi:hypothetical protein